MTALGNSKFVLSPPGNGIDCYRTWESLIMGAIPIVLNTSIWQLYVDMPVMIVNDWYRDVTIDSLTAVQILYNQVINRQRLMMANRPKIWAKYWIDAINKYR